MCLLKMANSRNPSEHVRFIDTEDTETAAAGAAVKGGDRLYGESEFFKEGDYSSMFRRYSMTVDMSAMVSALTHLVSGRKYRPDTTSVANSPSYCSSSWGVQSLLDGGETTEIDSFCQQSNELSALLVPYCSSHKCDSLNCERAVEVDPLLSLPIGEAVTNRGTVNLDVAHDDHIEDTSEMMQLDSHFEQPNLEINSAGNETTNNEKIHSQKNNTIQRIEKDHGITRKILEQHFGMTLEAAAKNLHVSRATLKRICRGYNISRWPHHKTRKVNFHVSQGVPFQGAEPFVDKQQCPALSQEKGTDCLGHKRSTATGVPHDSMMTLKVTYRGDIIKFQLPLSSTKAKLEREVEKRLKITLEKFSIKHQDEDDDWILIATNSDLRDGMHSLRLLGRTTMRLLVTPEADT